MQIYKVLIMWCLFGGIATAQIRPPQPDYSRYGSLNDQMIVYENLRRRQDALELQRYRRFREEVRRNMPAPETRVVVRSYRDPMCNWRQRR